MRNLRNIGHTETRHQGDLPLTAAAWDPTGESAQICAFGPTASKPIVEIRKVSQAPETPRPREGNEINGSASSATISFITSWDAPCPLPDLDCDEILSLQYFFDVGVACLVFAGGDLVIVRESPLPGEEKIEIIGSIDVGISAAAWSPDEELLAISTRAHTLLYMTRDLDQVSEVTLTSEDLKASRHVSMGWGKKETQFQGKRVKALRDPTMPETVDEGKPSPFEDGRTTISWRGDGAFVAINSVVSNDRRAIRVYSRDGILDSVSEPVDGLEGALSWRPSGNLLTSVQRLDTRIDVVFFERNGLRHGQFALRLSEDEMSNRGSCISLSWNVDSTVLAVSLLDRVQLWTMGNYHYYLKQEIGLSSDSLAPCSMRWHSEKPLKLLLQSSDCLRALEYSFGVSRGSTASPDDFGITAVIDGCTIKLTPLRLAGVPPPMSLIELKVDEVVVDCAISPRKQRVAVLTAKTLYCYHWDVSRAPVPSPVLIDSIARLDSKGYSDRQVLFCGDERLFLLNHTSESKSAIECFTFDSEGHLARVWVDLTANLISYLFTDLWHERVWWIEDGRPHFLKSHVESPQRQGPYVTNIPSLSVVQTEAINLSHSLDSAESDIPDPGEDGAFVIFSLTKQGHLYAGPRRMSSNCTSFILTPNHLIFTTSQHLLKFVHLATPKLIEIPGDTPEEDERCRSIERGACIVNVMPSAYAVVLQMPRGNLETIYPRALVLAGIRKHIDDADYRKAYLACRNHQVDTNILYDYRPDQFLSNLPLFVKQLSKEDRIDDFLSKLKDEDVTKTLYRNTLQRPEEPRVVDGDITDNIVPSKPNGISSLTPKDITDKVNLICAALLSILSPSTHLQSIITVHVCKRPPDLTAALNLVSSLLKSSPSDAESAISHLCFLTDPSTLYITSLSLHDLDLTLLVAQQSQRDPKEYLPYLHHLHSLPPQRRAFEIDDSLGQHAKALTYLHALGSHDEAETYVLKHSLYTTALDLYKYSQPQVSLYTRHYASYLSSTNHPLRAAILYESLSDHNSAYPLYALSHRWCESLSCALLSQPPLSPSQLYSHASSLITTLTEESRDFRSAAEIAKEHLHDIPLSASLLCRGAYFADAIRLLALHDLKDTIPEIVDAALATHFAEQTDLLSDCRAQLAAQVPRILDLRRKKLEDPLAFFGGDPTAVGGGGGGGGGGEGDVPDNLSLAPTDTSTRAGGTLFTRYSSGSRMTSKSKRREERKKARGKKGSVYEEGYLVASVGRLVDRVNSVGEEVARTVEGCWRRSIGTRERAIALDHAMGETIRACWEGVEEVWGLESQPGLAVAGKDGDANANANTGTDTDMQRHRHRPSGADGVQWDAEMGVGVEMPNRPEVRAWSGIMD